MASGDSSFAFKSLIFAMVVTVALPLLINMYATVDHPLNSTEALNGYYDFTGTAPASESVWVLSGIYTPFGVDEDGNADTTHYGYTEDGWLYGYRIENYTPSQYYGGVQDYSVRYDKGVYRYVSSDPDAQTGDVVTTYGNHKVGDMYTDVSMSKAKQSSIFFTPDLKTEQDGYFYYQFSGYRYAFQPTANYHTTNQNGDTVEVVANTTSLSLIWYNYYVEEQSGISGQLVITANDMSVAYLTASQIIQAFDTTTSSAKFNLNFRGINMNVYIRLDPYVLSQGKTVEDCYNQGYWSVMVTSLSTDSSAYTESNYGINASNLFDTVVDLLTFNYSDYDMNDAMGVLCSMLIVIPFYASLIALCIGSYPLLIGVGLLACFQTIASVVTNWGFPF